MPRGGTKLDETPVARKHRTLEDERLFKFGSFDVALKDRNIRRLLLCANSARQYASDILDSAVTSATEWHQNFKSVQDTRAQERIGGSHTSKGGAADFLSSDN